MISLRLEWIYDLAKKRPGGISRVVASWSGIHPPDRITFYRWFKKSMSVPPEQIIPLAAALNIDPLALYEVNPTTYRRLCLRLLRGALTKEDPIVNSFGWINDFIAPSREWPPIPIARIYSNTNNGWVCRDFTHPAREKKGHFQKLQFSVHRSSFLEPQVWHFAFRTAGIEEKFWRPYGFAIREEDRLTLYQLRGGTSFTSISSKADSFIVETWFGHGPAQFRVASLHHFELSLVSETELPTVRFPES